MFIIAWPCYRMFRRVIQRSVERSPFSARYASEDRIESKYDVTIDRSTRYMCGSISCCDRSCTAAVAAAAAINVPIVWY